MSVQPPLFLRPAFGGPSRLDRLPRDGPATRRRQRSRSRLPTLRRAQLAQGHGRRVAGVGYLGWRFGLSGRVPHDLVGELIGVARALSCSGRHGPLSHDGAFRKFSADLKLDHYPTADALDGRAAAVERARRGWDASGQRRPAACRGTDHESCRRSHSATARAITKTTASHPQSEVTLTQAPWGSQGSVTRCQANLSSTRPNNVTSRRNTPVDRLHGVL